MDKPGRHQTHQLTKRIQSYRLNKLISMDKQMSVPLVTTSRAIVIAPVMDSAFKNLWHDSTQALFLSRLTDDSNHSPSHRILPTKRAVRREFLHKTTRQFSCARLKYLP